MDIRMPELDGLEATRRILAADSGARILILTTFDLDEYVYEALRAGASGFVLKDDPPEQLLAAIHVVAGGDALLSPTVTKRVIKQFTRAPRPAPPKELDDLSERERRGLPSDRTRPLERGDRKGALHQRDDRQDARHAHPPEARPPRPCPGGRARLPVGALRGRRDVGHEGRAHGLTTLQPPASEHTMLSHCSTAERTVASRQPTRLALTYPRTFMADLHSHPRVVRRAPKRAHKPSSARATPRRRSAGRADDAHRRRTARLARRGRDRDLRERRPREPRPGALRRPPRDGGGRARARIAARGAPARGPRAAPLRRRPPGARPGASAARDEARGDRRAPRRDARHRRDPRPHAPQVLRPRRPGHLDGLDELDGGLVDAAGERRRPGRSTASGSPSRSRSRSRSSGSAASSQGTGTVEPRPVELGAGITVRPWFTPGNGEALSHRVAKHIGRARRRIRIASPVLTAGPILGTLVEVVNERRCHVVGVVDDTQSDDVFRQWSSNGVSAWKIPLLRTIVERAAFSGKPSTPWSPGAVQDFMHAKVVVADDVSFVGSFNFSRSGERNAENVRRDPRSGDRRRARAATSTTFAARYPPATPPDVGAPARTRHGPPQGESRIHEHTGVHQRPSRATARHRASRSSSSIVTLGIYSLYWVFKTQEEVKEHSGHRHRRRPRARDLHPPLAGDLVPDPVRGREDVPGRRPRGPRSPAGPGCGSCSRSSGRSSGSSRCRAECSFYCCAASTAGLLSRS